MNPPMVKVPLGLCKDDFRAPSAPPPLSHLSLGLPQSHHHHLPPPSPLAWFQNHCGGGGQLATSSPWDSYHHQQYFKAATAPASSFGSLSLFGLAPTSPLLPPLPPPHAHSVSSLPSNGLPNALSLKSLSPPAAHSQSDRPYMSSPGIFRPIPSRPTPPSAAASISHGTPLVIPRIDLDLEARKPTKSEEKSAASIKSEPEFLNDSDSAFEDGDGSFSYCSRTTPINHKSIRRWRQRSSPSLKPIITSTPQSNDRRRSTRDEEESGPNISGSSSSGLGSPFSSPTSASFESSFGTERSSPPSPLSSGGGKPSKQSEAIPIGIALARLRPSPPESLQQPQDLKKNPIHLNVPKVPLPNNNSNNNNNKEAPLLPLGYQWAKDPLSGQFYFLPSNPLWAATHHHHQQLGYLHWTQQHASPWLPPQMMQSVPPLFESQECLQGKEEVPSRTIPTPPPSLASTDGRISVGEEEKDKEIRREVVKSEASEEEEEAVSGLELLSEGISRLEKTESPKEQGKNNLSILIDAADTLEEPPVLESKHSIPTDLNRNYTSPAAEKEAKAFIASKSAKSEEDKSQSSQEDMEDWEIGMRMNLAEIQRKYKEKYKELYKLQKTCGHRRRKSSSDSTGSHPKKMIKTEEADWKSSETFDKKYKPEKSEEDPYGWVVPKKKKIFLASQKNEILSDKFKSGRPHPFENLLRLSKNRQSLDDDDDRSEEAIKDEDYEEDNKSSQNEILGDEKVIPKVFQRAEEEAYALPKEDDKSPPAEISHSNTRPNHEEDEEKALHQQPLVVSPLKIKKSFVSESKELECQLPKKKSKKSKKLKKDKRNREDKKKKLREKMRVSVIRTPPTSSCLDITQSKSPRKTFKRKWGSSDDEEDIEETEIGDQFVPKSAEDCVLFPDDLCDGLRVLTKIEGHFHPSTIKAISPPDIYGVVVDKERGNKPHIFSQEEVLKAAIYEVKPNSIDDFPIGTRVCAYWSQKYNHLYPGTIGEPCSPNPKLDPRFFVNVELDDGDSRDIHIDSVRYLPPDYPLVQYDPDPMAFGIRRRRMFSTDSTLSTSSISSTKTNVAKDEIIPQKVSRSRKESTSHITKVIIQSSDLKFKIRSSPELFESKTHSSNKSSMAAFLPDQQLWCWADEGVKKGRRILHNSIRRDDDETLSVGTCAVFLSTGRPDRPYIGRLEALWEALGSNSVRNMRVKVRWFYHACETKGKSKEGQLVEDMKLPGALFESYHYDENDVQTISHGCDVLSVSKFFSKLSEEPSRVKTIYENNDLYYLAGNYEPVEEDIKFYPKVFEDYKV